MEQKIKKIRKNDLPLKNFETASIMYSLSKSINNGREGNWSDCGFKNEIDFINFLDALVKANVIIKKTHPFSNSYNLANYLYIGNDCLQFDKKQRFLSWLKNNVLNLIVVLATCYSLFKQ